MSGLTDHALGEAGSLERGQTQVPDLHAPRGARDEDVVTLQVPVDDGGGTSVQKVKSFEDLTTPSLQELQLHLLKTLQIPEELWEIHEESVEEASLLLTKPVFI